MSDTLPPWNEGGWTPDWEPVVPAKMPPYIFVCYFRHGSSFLTPMPGSQLLYWLCAEGTEESSRGRAQPRWLWQEIAAPQMPV